MTRHRSFLLLVSCFLLLSSCDTTKKIFRKKETNLTIQNHESKKNRRSEIDSNWGRSASSLSHRDGSTRIDFDGDPVITLRPDQSIEISGGNPTIHSTATETRRDTLSETGSVTETIKEDSTGRSRGKQETATTVTDGEKTTKTQKIAPILVLAILLVILLLYRGRNAGRP